jgi:hypothetical protein
MLGVANWACTQKIKENYVANTVKILICPSFASSGNSFLVVIFRRGTGLILFIKMMTCVQFKTF